MRRYFILFLLLICAGVQSQAQLYYSGTEYGITIGGSQYFGDLNDKYGFKFIRPVGGVFLRQLVTPYISLRLGATYTHIGYSDALTDNAFNKARNLSFESDIVEVALQSEFNFTRFLTGDDGRRFTPYLTGGVGAFYYNPTTKFGGRTYSLRKLGTEGQNIEGYEGRKYGPVTVCFPVGAGFKYWLRPGFNLGFEIADRLTLTDYLDDVSTSYIGADKFNNNPDFPNPAYYLQDRSADPSSTAALGRAGKQRGTSQTRDQYLYAVINLSIQFKVYRCPNYQKEGELE